MEKIDGQFYPWILSQKEMTFLYKYNAYKHILSIKKFWKTRTSDQKFIIHIMAIGTVLRIIEITLRYLGVL
jgi:hypothetical protein